MAANASSPKGRIPSRLLSGVSPTSQTQPFSAPPISDHRRETHPAVPQMHDVDAVARRLGVSSKTVRRMIGCGELPVHRIGKQLRISDDDLAEFLTKRRSIR